jgi:hypothetical protein
MSGTDAGLSTPASANGTGDTHLSALPSVNGGPPEGSITTATRLTRWEISASGLGWFAPSAIRPGLDAEASIFLAENWRISAQFALGTSDSATIIDEGNHRRGTLSTQPFLALAGASYCRRAAADLLRGCGGIVAGAHLATATAQGDFVFQSTSRWLVRPSFGLEAQLAWLPIQYFALSLALTGAVNPVAGAFEVEGVPTAQTSLPLFEGLLRLSIAFGANR